MNDLLLPLAVWVTGVVTRTAEAARGALRHAADDRGSIDDSVGKMILLAIGVALAIAVGAFALGVFNDAKDTVPDPVAPAP